MKWTNHIIIAGATTAVFNPALVPVAILGSTAPDWFETVANKFFNARLKHRGKTHILTHWLIAFLFFVFIYDYRGIFAAFAWGGLTHVLADSFTVSGVPLSPMSQRRFHLFGGRITTGSPQEYVISCTIAIICALAIYTFGANLSFDQTNSTGFIPYFFEWWDYYADGLIDAAEWKQNRFKFI